MPRVPPGRKGPSGQTLVPVLGVVAHGEKRLVKIISVEPTAAVGQYLTADGVTSNPDKAVDIRGQPGVVTTEQEVVVVPGKPGDPGAAATIEVGEVEQLPAGSMPTVENVGDRNAARLNFGIPAPEKPMMPANGVDGRSITAGQGAPAETLGSAGDLYLDTDTGDLYRKS